MLLQGAIHHKFIDIISSKFSSCSTPNPHLRRDGAGLFFLFLLNSVPKPGSRACNHAKQPQSQGLHSGSWIILNLLITDYGLVIGFRLPHPLSENDR